jgi:hypothetical protein
VNADELPLVVRRIELGPVLMSREEYDELTEPGLVAAVTKWHDDLLARLFDAAFPNTTVPACLAGPRAPRAGNPPCPECGWDEGHAWTCSLGRNDP